MQSAAEKRKQAYLHQLRNSGQLKASLIVGGEPKMVTISNPHLEEDDGRWRVAGEHKGHLVSRFVKPPPCD